MKVGILCAGDREVAPFIPMIENDKVTEKAMLSFHEGLIEGVQVVALFSGVCKVNAAIAAQILLDTYNCDVIINAGTAGAMNTALNILDVVVSEEAVYHDADAGILTDFHPWLKQACFKADQTLLTLAKQTAQRFSAEGKIVFGRMATGEKFIEDDQREEINARHSPLCVDMETAAIAHVCHVNQKPFIAVRTITDTPDHSGAAAFEENCAKAAKISADFVRSMLLSSDWRAQQ